MKFVLGTNGFLKAIEKLSGSSELFEKLSGSKEPLEPPLTRPLTTRADEKKKPQTLLTNYID